MGACDHGYGRGHEYARDRGHDLHDREYARDRGHDLHDREYARDHGHGHAHVHALHIPDAHQNHMP